MTISRIDIFVPGVPVSQPRHGHQLITRSDGSRFIKTFTPKRKIGPKTKGGTVQGWKDTITAYLSGHRPTTPWNGPVSLELIFYMPRTDELEKPKAAAGVLLCFVKPDEDNLRKAVMDAMTRCKIWSDDSRVCDSITRKRYPAKGYAPGLRIIAQHLDPQETLL